MRLTPATEVIEAEPIDRARRLRTAAPPNLFGHRPRRSHLHEDGGARGERSRMSSESAGACPRRSAAASSSPPKAGRRSGRCSASSPRSAGHGRTKAGTDTSPASKRALSTARSSGAESECSRVESKWKNERPLCEQRSWRKPAQSRRALHAPLGQIAVLAGYEGAARRRDPERARTSSSRAARTGAVRSTRLPPRRRSFEKIARLIRTLDGDRPRDRLAGPSVRVRRPGLRMLTKTAPRS